MSRLFRRRPLAGLATLAGLGLLAAGCSGGGGSAAPGGLEKTNLTVAAVPALDSAGLYIAKQRGLFAAQGLNVSILPAVSGATTIASQLKGQVDISAGNYVSYIEANTQAKDPAHFRVLAPASIMQADNQDIVVPQHSGITTVSDLAGKTIGVNVKNNIGTLLISSILSDNSVTVNAKQFVPIQFPDMGKALADHKVDAAWLPQPFITEDEEQYGVQPLADANQGSTQDLPIEGYMVTQSWLKKYPNTAAAFRRALLKAQAIAVSDPGAVQQGMAKFAKTPMQSAAIAGAPEFPTQQSASVLQRVANLMLNFGMLQQHYDVTPMVVR